jgi:hypothetical protein
VLDVSWRLVGALVACEVSEWEETVDKGMSQGGLTFNSLVDGFVCIVSPRLFLLWQVYVRSSIIL